MAGLGQNLGTSEYHLADLVRLARMGQKDRMGPLDQMGRKDRKGPQGLGYLGLAGLESRHLERLELG